MFVLNNNNKKSKQRQQKSTQRNGFEPSNFTASFMLLLDTLLN